jgi:hypothetical protein
VTYPDAASRPDLPDGRFSKAIGGVHREIMRGHRGSRLAIAAAALAVTAVGVGNALAAGAPAATTGAASRVSGTSATLNGTVTPGQGATTYAFQYGPTASYGTQTPTQGPVNGTKAKKVSAAVTGLVPATTYHFRVLATNAAGTTYGSDATFATPAAKNTVTIAAVPKTLTFGRSTTIAGQVSGVGNAGVAVTLEQSPYPYTAAFAPTGVTTTTNATGAYTLAVAPSVNTHYRVTVKTKPPVTSAVTAVAVRVKVGLRLSDLTPAKGQRVRFSGTVTPAHDGKLARIQKRTSTGAWKTVASTPLVTTTPVNGVARSKFSKRLRISSTATYRVRVTPADGDHAAGTSPARRARVH